MKASKKIYGIGLALTCGLASTLNGQDLYVVNSGNPLGFPIDNPTIGEYGLDGSTVNASLITEFGPPWGIAISGGDLFVENAGIAIWGNDMFVANGASFDSTIGEYTTSGSTVNSSLITGLDEPFGIAISGDDVFVASWNNDFGSTGTIGEYTTSGATVNATLISGLAEPTGIAISGNDLFVANDSAGTIGEYGLDGSTVNASLISGMDDPSGIAVFGNDLFVANAGNGTIGEYGLDGSTVNASLISGLDNPAGIAISPAPEPSTVALTGLGAAALCVWRRRRDN